MLESEESMFIADIWRTWESKSEGIVKNTVSMVATDANPLCRLVHNKPKPVKGRGSWQSWIGIQQMPG